MKHLFSFTVLLATVSNASATSFNCKVAEDNNSGFANSAIQLNLASTRLTLTFTSPTGKVDVVTAVRSGKSYTKETRFVDGKTNLATSDSGKTEILVGAALFNGKTGKVTINGDQANDGDGGSQYLPFLDAVLTCKPSGTI